MGCCAIDAARCRGWGDPGCVSCVALLHFIDTRHIYSAGIAKMCLLTYLLFVSYVTPHHRPAQGSTRGS